MRTQILKSVLKLNLIQYKSLSSSEREIQNRELVLLNICMSLGFSRTCVMGVAYNNEDASLIYF